MFNLTGDLSIGDETLPQGVIMTPVNKQAENIVLASGARIAGIRFHPAIGYGVLGQRYDKPILLLPEEDKLYGLYKIYDRLKSLSDNESRIEALYRWADENLDFTHVIPDSLEIALKFIDREEALSELSSKTILSQRQIERLFKRNLGMTPKHYQRILRIKKAICFLRLHNNVYLADVALQFGFSDQAHMTREFRDIARITPGQI